MNSNGLIRECGGGVFLSRGDAPDRRFHRAFEAACAPQAAHPVKLGACFQFQPGGIILPMAVNLFSVRLSRFLLRRYQFNPGCQTGLTPGVKRYFPFIEKMLDIFEPGFERWNRAAFESPQKPASGPATDKSREMRGSYIRPAHVSRERDQTESPPQ